MTQRLPLREIEIQSIEARYPIPFLELSLHGDAIRWRELVAERNRAEATADDGGQKR